VKKVIFQCWPVDQGLVSREEADACVTLSAPVLGSKACQQLVKHVSSGRGVEAARNKGAGVAGFNERAQALQALMKGRRRCRL
jgi:hypothetical protein